MKLLLTSALVCGALYILHRLARWAEDRGLIYYRRYRPTRSALGNAFLEVQTIVDPGKRLLLETRRKERVEEGAQGDPPVPGGGPARGPGDAPAPANGLLLHPAELAARIVAADVNRCGGAFRPTVRTLQSSRR